MISNIRLIFLSLIISLVYKNLNAQTSNHNLTLTGTDWGGSIDLKSTKTNDFWHIIGPRYIDGNGSTNRLSIYLNNGNWNEYFTILKNGNIGIGTENPGHKLDVAGRARIRSGGGNTAGIWYMNAANTLDRSFIGMVDDNNIGFYGGTAGWGLQMNVNSGATKIATTSSNGSALEVQHPGFLISRFKNNNTTSTADKSAIIQIENGDATSTSWYMGVGGKGNGLSLTDGQFYFERIGAGALMTITKNGNVGVGTRYPGDYKLAVNGKMRAHELVIELNGWSDFVFEKNYKLRSLSEVETFVKENKHLPEIPSAKEVEENGVTVGKMESLLLMKVEELTLYLIEQNKQIQALQEQNQKLESKLESISKESK